MLMTFVMNMDCSAGLLIFNLLMDVYRSRQLVMLWKINYMVPSSDFCQFGTGYLFQAPRGTLTPTVMYSSIEDWPIIPF